MARYTIEMESKTFGVETFDYDSKEEMQQALLRLVDCAMMWQKKDGVCRSFVVARNWKERLSERR